MYFPYPHYAQYYPHTTSTMMPQPCEIPMNPFPPVTLPRPDLYAPTKRRRDEFDTAMIGDFEGSAAKRSKMQDVIFRIVVPARQIGKVIGKEGCRIQRIREDTKATIKIADSVARHEERVIIISSWKESDKDVTDAENALKQISNLILKEDNGPEGAGKVVSAGHVGANTIRLLIAGSQAGFLIGVSGQNIEKLRNSSGASITVLPPNQLPLCASAHESDRVVQIAGDVPVVLKAIEEIGYQLRTTNLAADYVTMEMMVSEAFVGGLIGRCGSNISRIRNESGATIKVYGGKGEQKDRHIQFGGTAQQVALAKQRVDEYLYSQMAQQAGQQ